MKKYSGLAEAWYDQFYQPMTLTNYLRAWWNGIDVRKSVVINFGIYLERQEET